MVSGVTMGRLVAAKGIGPLGVRPCSFSFFLNSCPVCGLNEGQSGGQNFLFYV